MAGGRPSDGAELLRCRGVQVSVQRLAVPAAVGGPPRSALNEIAAAVRDRTGGISRQTVHDAPGAGRA